MNLALLAAPLLVAAPPSSGVLSAGAIPPHGALVHLKAAVCNQRASVTISHLGKGLVLFRDAPLVPRPQAFYDSYSWLANTPSLPIGNGRIDAGSWVKLFPPLSSAGKSYTLTFASSDCRGQDTRYLANATTVKVKIT